MLKLCVGAESLEDLQSWSQERLHRMKAAGEKTPPLSCHPHDAKARRRIARWRLALLGY